MPMCVRVGDLDPQLAERVMMMHPGRVPRSRFARDGAIADVPRAAAAGGLEWGLVAVDYFDSWAGPGREVGCASAAAGVPTTNDK